jgi:hypothetical protein
MMMPLASRSCAMHDMRRQIILLVLYSTSSSTVDLTMHEPARFYPGLSVLISTTDLPLRCRPAQLHKIDSGDSLCMSLDGIPSTVKTTKQHARYKFVRASENDLQ